VGAWSRAGVIRPSLEAFEALAEEAEPALV